MINKQTKTYEVVVNFTFDAEGPEEAADKVKDLVEEESVSSVSLQRVETFCKRRVVVEAKSNLQPSLFFANLEDKQRRVQYGPKDCYFYTLIIYYDYGVTINDVVADVEKEVESYCNQETEITSIRIERE